MRTFFLWGVYISIFNINLVQLLPCIQDRPLPLCPIWGYCHSMGIESSWISTSSLHATLWHLYTQPAACHHNRTLLYFVSPWERPWRQRVLWTKTLVVARATCGFFHAFKKEHWDWCIKIASCSVYPWARSVTSRSFSGWDKV